VIFSGVTTVLIQGGNLAERAHSPGYRMRPTSQH